MVIKLHSESGVMEYVPGRVRQEDAEFEANLGYDVSRDPAKQSK